MKRFTLCSFIFFSYYGYYNRSVIAFLSKTCTVKLIPDKDVFCGQCICIRVTVCRTNAECSQLIMHNQDSQIHHRIYLLFTSQGFSFQTWVVMNYIHSAVRRGTVVGSESSEVTHLSIDVDYFCFSEMSFWLNINCLLLLCGKHVIKMVKLNFMRPRWIESLPVEGQEVCLFIGLGFFIFF